MSSTSNNTEEQGRNPASSLLNAFSSFFTRDRHPDSAMLTSYKEFPDGKNVLPEDGQDTYSDYSLKGRMDAGATGTHVDPDLVYVTKVETCSDTENEDEVSSHRSTVLPMEDNNTVDHSGGEQLQPGTEDEAEYKLPTFKIHRFSEKSRVEAILYSDKFLNRRSSGTSLSSVSKQEDGCTPIGTNENDEYGRLDYSQSDSSIISGHHAPEAASHNVAMVSPSKPIEDLYSTQKEETLVTSSPTTPELFTDPDEQSDTAGVRTPTLLSSTPENPLADSPTSLHTMSPKTPEMHTPPSASPVTPSLNSSLSSGTAVSSSPSFQMPALFSGLRVLKKGAVGEERETVSEIKQREKDAELALLSLKKTVNKAKLLPEQKTPSPAKKHPEPKSVSDTKSTVFGQLSHLLNKDSHNETKQSDHGQDADLKLSQKQSENRNSTEVLDKEKSSVPETPTSTPERKKTSDLAYETFKNIFGPKTTTKDKAEDVDLEAVKRKIKNDKESLRSIFERSSKSPVKEASSLIEPNVCTECASISKYIRNHCILR